MMKLATVFAATLACTSFAAPVKRAIPTATISGGVSFSGNVSLADPNQFKYRDAKLVTLDIPLVASALVYSSLAVDGKSDSNSGSVSVDSIFGLAYFPTLLFPFPPTCWMAYYSADAKVTTAPGKVDVSVDAAGSLVSTVYSGVVEKKADGTVVKTVKFKELQFSLGTAKEDASKNLMWNTFSANSGKAKVEITFIVSKVVGKLNIGDATITPQSIESVVEVKDYEYADATNYLELNMIVGQASAQGAVSYSATNTLIAGSGDSQVYVQFSGQAVVDGKAVDVQVSGYASKDIEPSQIENSYLEAQLRANADWKTSIRQVQIKFPANAKSISYDPAIGVKAPNSSAAMIPFLFSVVLAVVLALYM